MPSAEHPPPLCRRSPSRLARLALTGCIAVAAAVLQWIATSPRWLVHINWDAASYLHGIAAGEITWASPTWTAHAGLQYLYLAACALAEFLGGTPVDGFRLLGAVCFALSAATIADVGQRLVRDRLLVVLLVVA